MSILKTPEKVVKEEEQRATEFFNLDDYETPEIERGLHFPTSHGLNKPNKLKLPYKVPARVVEHEARHITHFNVSEQVIDENLDEVKEFYKEELANLNTSNLHFNGLIDSLLHEDREIQNIERMDAGEMNKAVIERNYETCNQAENYANNTEWKEAIPTALYASGLGATAHTVGENFEYLSETLSNSPSDLAPLATGAGLVAVGGALSAASTYDAARNEALKDSNLDNYSPEERRVAMLYNDKVEPTLDEFLELADDYGIN